MGTKSDGAASGLVEAASSDQGGPTREQDLHALDTALLPVARGCRVATKLDPGIRSLVPGTLVGEFVIRTSSGVVAAVQAL